MRPFGDAMVDAAGLAAEIGLFESEVRGLAARRAWLWGALPVPTVDGRPRTWSLADIDDWLALNEEC